MRREDGDFPADIRFDSPIRLRSARSISLEWLGEGVDSPTAADDAIPSDGDQLPHNWMLGDYGPI